jgi:DnaJ domain
MLRRERLSGLVVNPILMRMPRASIESSAGPSAAAAATRLCDHPGCTASGDYRAPQGRDRLQTFFWFCLDHVRAYNAQWNYYAGMSAAEIEAEIRNDTVWQRPTWPIGSRCGMRFDAHVRDFGLFGFDEEDAELRERPKKRPLSEQEQALAVFDLTLPLTLSSLKARYKALVKLHHPDAHGGDRDAEERLKVINQAYSTLKTSYFPSG